MTKGTLYLIPTTLGDNDSYKRVIPDYNNQIVFQLAHFIVEKTRTARRFLKEIGHPIPIDKMQFVELNKHTNAEEYSNYLDLAEKGISLGLLSEAGTPAVADPGSVIVKLAHQKGIRVVPLSGPNSIILALMASGFSGQQFCFHGYLPKEGSELSKKIKLLEADAQRDITQIFIETPFRNNKMLESLIKNCKPQTMLCIAADLTLPNEHVISKSIAQWKKETADLNKKPAVFLIGK
ncbi:MAG: SAM-dependent methyltransferase [Bacteroidales bacterium]|nr:SAM-dependent methyltransferase [Bacteroidales bacterium]